MAFLTKSILGLNIKFLPLRIIKTVICKNKILLWYSCTKTWLIMILLFLYIFHTKYKAITIAFVSHQRRFSCDSHNALCSLPLMFWETPVGGFLKHCDLGIVCYVTWGERCGRKSAITGGGGGREWNPILLLPVNFAKVLCKVRVGLKSCLPRCWFYQYYI